MATQDNIPTRRREEGDAGSDREEEEGTTVADTLRDPGARAPPTIGDNDNSADPAAVLFDPRKTLRERFGTSTGRVLQEKIFAAYKVRCEIKNLDHRIAVNLQVHLYEYQ